MNLTKNNRAANIKTWKATAPAVHRSPLRMIHKHRPDIRNPDGHLIGEDPIYTEARRAAARGDGATVKRIARAVAGMAA